MIWAVHKWDPQCDKRAPSVQGTVTRNGHQCNVTFGSSCIIHNNEVSKEPMLKWKVTEKTILPGKIGTTHTTNCMDILQKQDTLMAKIILIYVILTKDSVRSSNRKLRKPLIMDQKV